MIEKKILPDNETKIKVGYKFINIIEKHDKIMEKKTECEGLYEPYEKRILIADFLKGYSKIQTTLHEIFHAFSIIYSIGLSEKQVDQLATAIVMLEQDNPSFLENLLKLKEKEVNQSGEQRASAAKIKRSTSNARRISNKKRSSRKS